MWQQNNTQQPPNSEPQQTEYNATLFFFATCNAPPVRTIGYMARACHKVVAQSLGNKENGMRPQNGRMHMLVKKRKR